MTLAPLGPADAPEIAALWRACQLHSDGEAIVTDTDLESMFQRPSLDPTRQVTGLRDGGELGAFGILLTPREVQACVLPSHRGRGIGTALMRWTWEAARAAGADEVGQSLSENEHDARALLAGAGYTTEWTSWMLAIDLDREPAAGPLPPGYSIGPFVPGVHDEETYRVVEGAFSEWPGRDPESFGDWASETTARPGFEPWHLQLAFHGEAIAGAIYALEEEGEGWVGQLAVAREHRRRGLGEALLQHGFAALWARGLRRCALWTDSRTGALPLYERAGMRVRRTYAHYLKRL